MDAGMKELFLSVFMMSLMCSLLLAPLLVFSRKLQSRYAAKTLYFLWLLLAIRMVLPNVPIMPQAPVTVEVPSVEVYLPTNPFRPSAGASDTPTTQVETAESWNSVTMTERPIVTVSRSIELGVLAAWVWLTGMAVFLLWQMLAYMIARGSILRRSVPATDDEWALLGHLCADMSVGKALNLCRSERVESPMLLGLFSPMVVLPDRDSDPDELEAVLRHELCHLKRGDVAYKSFLLLCNAIHWFNPLVWLMARAASRNVEFCCDDQVLRHADGPTRKHYGEVLLYTAAGSIYPAFSTHFGSGKEQLRERLLNLFKPKKNSAVLVCAVAAVALLAGGAVAFESGRSNMPSTPPVVEVESATPTQTPLPVPTPNLGPTKFETFYALLPGITEDATSDDYETVTFRVADYVAEKGTITATGETRTLSMAGDVRLARDVSGNALWAGEKGTIERQQALVNFFLWPLLRSTYTGGRTDFFEVIVENGQVAQMSLLLTARTARSAVDMLVASIQYKDGEFLFSLPDDYTPVSDWNIHISGRAPMGSGFMSVHYLENTLWETGKVYSFTDGFIGSAKTPAEGSELTMVLVCGDVERSVNLLGIAAGGVTQGIAPPAMPTPVETPKAPVNLPVEGTPEVVAEPLPPDTGKSKTVIELSSGGQSSITKSSFFKAEAGQTLTLTVTSDISGGTVDLFLFSPAGKQERVTIGGEDMTKTITLTDGTWAYNCTGFFEGGSVSIVGTAK